MEHHTCDGEMYASRGEEDKQQQLPAGDVSISIPNGSAHLRRRTSSDVPISKPNEAAFSPRRTPRSTDQAPGYEPPTVEKALEFRRMNMPHRVKAPNQPTGYRLARIGERNDALGEPAELYRFCDTGPKQLDEFGIGIGLYFRQLFYMGMVLGVCVLVYIASIIHNIGFNKLANTSTWLNGTVHGAFLSDLKWTLTGIPDIVVVVVLLLFNLTAKKAESIAVEAIDVSQQTPQDYSVCIHSPPSNFIDPDRYYRQYSKYGEIVFVTVVLNNGKLLKEISEKRVIDHQIKALRATEQRRRREAGNSSVNILETETKLPWWKTMLQPLGLFKTLESLELRRKKVKAAIQKTCTTEEFFKPKRAYIIFNKEESQRRCLRDCETGMIEERFNKHWNPDSVLGDKIVFIDKAEEPSEIMWENLHFGLLHRNFLNSLSLVVAGVYLYLVYLIINYLSDNGSFFAALVVFAVNASLPWAVKFLVFVIEIHKSLTTQQASMMLKLVVARMVNTAILLYISTNWVESFTKNALGQVMTILIFDAFGTPMFRLVGLNVVNFITTRFIAIRMTTQSEMNSFMKGADWNLAERYTDMVKTVFVGLFYSTIVPTGLLVSVIAMVVTYYVDMYSLLRLWTRPPAYDSSLAALSRKYLFLCVWVHLVTTRVYFSNWPYIRQFGDEDVSNESDANKSSCGLFRCSFSANRVGVEMPTIGQKRLVNLYELFGILLFSFGVGFIVIFYSHKCIARMLNKKSIEIGAPSEIPYRSISGIPCYIPLTRPRQLLDPLFGIDIVNFPANAQRYLPLPVGGVYSAEKLSMSTENEFPGLSEECRKSLFSTCKYYPAANESLQEGGTEDFVYEKGGYLDSNQPLQQPHLFERSRSMGIGFDLLNNVMPIEPMLPAQIIEGEGAELPENWEQHFTPNGRPFYVDHKNRTTSWIHPNAQASGSLITPKGLAPPETDLHCVLSDIPKGWEVRVSEDGRPYYVNHILKTTQWEHPRLGEAEDSGEGQQQSRKLSFFHDDSLDLDDFFDDDAADGTTIKEKEDD